MKGISLRLALLLLFCINTKKCFSQSKCETDIIKELFNCWIALDYRHTYADALTTKEINELKKMKACFEQNKAIIFKDTFYNTQYRISIHNSKEYLWDNYTAEQNEYGIITDSLYEITIDYKIRSRKDNKLYPSNRSILYSNNNLFIFHNGVLFRFTNKSSKTVYRTTG